ncbi:hypothetical protein H6G00_00750 [Leptolyngbya sp. FACHB-541]|uniref:hypothetical protein n=1 Tax=Leptolyngbya sp. FACHB-541 TaxID=2692810 RepID=UPI001681FC6A|nr:hypothetical protein [Leptolyngbya sp. FACHB-541]MBD1995156.1 hypothetical protein [Leptolyngbya sp. FACHB-541]
MSDDLQDLLRSRQAKQNASLNESVLQEQLNADRMPRPMVSQGFDADSGTALVQPLGGEVLTARTITSGAIATGSTVVGRQSGQILRVDQMPSQRGSEEQFRTQTVTAIPVLFLVDIGNSVEYWVGGDRSTPIKVATIPKYGPEFELSGSFSGSLARSGQTEGTLSLATEGMFYQNVQAFGQAGGSSVTGNVTYPSNQPFIPNGNLFGSLGFGQTFAVGRFQFFVPSGAGDGFNKTNLPGTFAVPPTVNFTPGQSFPLSNTDSVSEGRNDISEAGINYERPAQIHYQASISGRGFATDDDRVYRADFSGSGGGSLRATAREVYSRRVYMSAAGRNVYVTIAYDLKAAGYANLLMFAILGDRVVELGQPTRQDWRRSLAVLDYKPPSTGDICIDQLRENGKVNLLQRTRLEADFTEVEGDLKTTDLMVPILRQTITPGGDRCQVTPIPPQTIPPVKLYSLQNSAAVPLYICPTQYQRRVER